MPIGLAGTTCIATTPGDQSSSESIFKVKPINLNADISYNVIYLILLRFRLKQRWIEVSIDTQVDELLKAVKDSRSKSGDSCRSIVFANTVEAVEAVAKILRNAGTECYRYHKDCSLEERAETLNDFQEKGGVLVCTDAASRGVDIPNISHVIQVSFYLAFFKA